MLILYPHWLYQCGYSLWWEGLISRWSTFFFFFLFPQLAVLTLVYLIRIADGKYHQCCCTKQRTAEKSG